MPFLLIRLYNWWHFRRERKLNRITPGYGWCFRCYRSWRRAIPHETMYTPKRGCHPLCRDCWPSLTPAERMPYYRALVEQWLRESAVSRASIHEQWQQIQTAVLEGK